jgi:peptide/nickel transport system permease protein
VQAYVAKKVLLALLTLFFVLTLDFLLFRVLPDNPLDVLHRFAGASEPDKVAELTQRNALDEPIFPDQFLVFLRQMVTLDLGEEFSRGEPAWSVIRRFAPPTFFLMGTATVLAATIGVSLGAVGGWRRAGPLDRGATGFSLVMMCVPPFVLAAMLVTVFGSGVLGWFPSSGTRSLDELSGLTWAVDRLNHAFLPVVALTLPAIAPFYLITRESMVDVLGEDFLTLATAKGLRERAIRLRYAARNAMLPVLTLLLFSFGAVLSGSIAVEYVFGYPGLGLLTVVALTTRNFPILQGVFLLFATLMIGCNLVADITYASLDPRVRRV